MSFSIISWLGQREESFTISKDSFEELERALVAQYGTGPFAIRYEDDDGDMISVSSTIEFQEALRVAKGKPLRLFLSRSAKTNPEVVAVHTDAAPIVKTEQVAKAAAVQAFWDAEEARQRQVKEARDAEELRLKEEQSNAEKKRSLEEVRRKIQEEQRKLEEEQRRLEEEQRKLEEEMREIQRKAQEEQQKLEAEKAALAEFEAMQQEIRRNAEEAERVRTARVQVFWDEEAARQRAEKDARAAVEATLLNVPEHASIQCDVCNVHPIVGTRYQCTICQDFDLCADCEAKPGSHPVDHPLLKHKQPASTVTVHHGVTCDNCNKSPITGARFKCKLCPNFDLCEECEGKDVHPADHPLFKFRLEHRGGPRLGMARGRCGGFKGFLHRGASGPRVRKLQERLGVPADGLFGDQTEQAVKQFQSQHDLTADGVVGPLTKQVLRVVFGKGRKAAKQEINF